MTLKEAMARVFDSPAGTYPEGWNTKLATIIRDSGRECYERRQKRVWVFTARACYDGGSLTTMVFRSREKAKAAMEEDIRETAATIPRFEIEDLVRDDDLNARFGNEMFWEIDRLVLND